MLSAKDITGLPYAVEQRSSHGSACRRHTIRMLSAKDITGLPYAVEQRSGHGSACRRHTILKGTAAQQ